MKRCDNRCCCAVL